MILKVTLFVVGFLNAIIASGQSDTLKIVANTKYGELTFTKYCKANKLEFVQSKKPIVNKRVEKEAWMKNIAQDSLTVKFHIDDAGRPSKFEIVKKAKLKTLNVFVHKLFKDAISKMRYEKNTLSCDGKASSYLMPVIYERQKLKRHLAELKID